MSFPRLEGDLSEEQTFVLMRRAAFDSAAGQMTVTWCLRIHLPTTTGRGRKAFTLVGDSARDCFEQAGKWYAAGCPEVGETVDLEEEA